MGSAATTIPPIAPASRPSRPPPSYSAARRASARPAASGDTVNLRPQRSASVIPFPRAAVVAPQIPPAPRVPVIAEPQVIAPVARPRATAPSAVTSPQRPLAIAAAAQPGLTLMILRADGGAARNLRLNSTMLVVAAVIATCAVSAALGLGWTIGTFTAGL